MRLNYVIAAWGGPRRSDDPRAQSDRTFFLRQHIKALTHTQHSMIERVTVVVPRYEDESPEFTRYLEHLDLTGCHVRRRTNAGYSYGSWTETYEQTRGEFDGFIFVEDDYVFAIDNFDRFLVEEARRTGTGFLCGAVLPFHHRGCVMHPGIALGYCPTWALDRWAAHRPLPHVTDLPPTATHDEYGSYQHAEFWQVTWGADYAALGIPVTDWLATYASPFWTFRDDVRWYGARDAVPLVKPIQAVGRGAVLRYDPEETWQDTVTW